MSSKINNTMNDMLTDTELDELKPEILQLLQKTFAEMDITRVYIRPDYDSDGDPILKITVAFKGKIPEKTNIVGNAIAKIRERLSQNNIADFPMMTFLTEKNASKYICP